MEGLERWQNNQVKKMGIGRLGLIFFMIGGMLFVVLRSGQTTYLVIQVVLLFSALFFGYRFGPGAGAIAGSISGIMLSLVSGEAAQIGILCLLGIFSGAFRSLGRMASVTACAAAAYILRLFYFRRWNLFWQLVLYFYCFLKNLPVRKNKICLRKIVDLMNKKAHQCGRQR